MFKPLKILNWKCVPKMQYCPTGWKLAAGNLARNKKQPRPLPIVIKRKSWNSWIWTFWKHIKSRISMCLKYGKPRIQIFCNIIGILKFVISREMSKPIRAARVAQDKSVCWTSYCALTSTEFAISNPAQVMCPCHAPGTYASKTTYTSVLAFNSHTSPSSISPTQNGMNVEIKSNTNKRQHESEQWHEYIVRQWWYVHCTCKFALSGISTKECNSACANVYGEVASIVLFLTHVEHTCKHITDSAKHYVHKTKQGTCHTKAWHRPLRQEYDVHAFRPRINIQHVLHNVSCIVWNNSCEQRQSQSYFEQTVHWDHLWW